MKLKMIHLTILFISIFFAKCDGDLCDSSKCKVENNHCVDVNRNYPGTCNQNCKPNLLNKFDMKCYDCSSSYGKRYYSINDPNCVGSDTCNGLVIQGYNQCVDSCGDSLFKLGDFCYISFPNPDVLICNENDNSCICKYFYQIDDIDGKKNYDCYSQSKYCKEPNSYLYFNDGSSGLCSKDPCPNKRTRIYSNSRDTYRCSDKCKSSEFLSVEMENLVEVKNCLEYCPKKYYVNDDNEKICIKACNSDYPKNKKNQCIKESECKYIEGDNCYDSCTESSIKKYHNFNDKNCIYDCDSTTAYKFKLDYTCYSECPSHFVKLEEKKCIPESDASNCFYIEDESEIIPQNNKECYDKCPTRHEYYNYNSKKCISSCTANNNDYKFHKEGSFECYPSCIDIPTIGEYIYEDNFVCSNVECSLYISLDNGVKQCCQRETTCIDKGYNFKNGKECVEGCLNFKALYRTNGMIVLSLGICFADKDDCISNNYFYYNSQDKICWNDGCGEYYYTNELDTATNKPKEDYSGNTCTKNCFEPYSKLSSDGKFCKANCDTNEYFITDEPNKCKQNLESCEGFLKENNECVSVCPSYII